MSDPIHQKYQDLQNQHAKLKLSHDKEVSEHSDTKRKLADAEAQLQQSGDLKIASEKNQQAILVHLSGRESMTTADIIAVTNLSQHMVEHHLQQLESAGFVYADPVTYGTPLEWELTPKGRDYLIERGLLK